MFLLFAAAIDVVEQGCEPALVGQSHGGAESDELVHHCHVDAIVVGVAHLRRGAYHHDALRVQAVENANDALAQRSAAHDAVVDHHEVVNARPDAAVSDVVHVGGEVVAAVALGDEGAHLDVLPRHFLRTYAARKNALEVGVGGSTAEAFYLFDFLLVEIVVKSFHHAVIGRLGGVGDIAEHRVVQFIVHGFEDRLDERPPQFLALTVDVHVGAAAEIHAFEGAGLHVLCRQYLLRAQPAAFVHQQGFAGLEFVHVLCFHVERGLNDGAFRCHHHYLVVLIPEGGPDAPGVAHAHHLAAARHAAKHVAAVPHGGGELEHVGQVDVVFDVARDVCIGKSLLHSLVEAAFAFAVEPVPELFEEDIRVRHHARVLSLHGYFVEDFRHVRHVEVGADAEVLGAPVVAPQERMDIRKATFAGSGIP